MKSFLQYITENYGEDIRLNRLVDKEVKELERLVIYINYFTEKKSPSYDHITDLHSDLMEMNEKANDNSPIQKQAWEKFCKTESCNHLKSLLKSFKTDPHILSYKYATSFMNDLTALEQNIQDAQNSANKLLKW
jgi:hypothetical protein